MNKSYVMWENAKQWCRTNPGKEAGIVGPEGAFILTWVPKSETLKGVSATDQQPVATQNFECL